MRCRILAGLFGSLISGVALAQSATPIEAELLHTIQNGAYSGVAYYAGMRALGIPSTSDGAGTSTAPPSPDNPTGVFTTKATDDPYQDVEPAIGTVAVNGTRYLATAYMRYLNANSPSRIATRATTDIYSGFPYAWTLSISGAYEWSGDPSLAANDSDAGPGPRRLYCGGMMFNSIPQNPSAVAVWRSDNGGVSWSSPSTVATNPGGIYFLDKPWIAVSSHAGSRGYVYVAYVRLNNIDRNGATIFLARSMDGGVSFAQPTAVASGNVGGPQVAVDPATGTVYVVWANYITGVIASAASSNYGVSFGAVETVPGSGPYLLGPASFCVVPGPGLASGVRAFTLPMARFNLTDGSLGVVWHERESAPQLLSCPDPNQLGVWTTPPTNVYFAYRDVNGWHQKVLVNTNYTSTDQFMPAVVADSTGDVMITWYDTRDDASRATYKPYYTYSSAHGVRLMDDFRLANFASNPATYPYRFIGDYQDLALLQSVGIPVFAASWVGIVGTAGNIYVSRAQ